ncbi:MAG: hypothetical protein ABUT20_59305, partial [Bacteroidota bacterium]
MRTCLLIFFPLFIAFNSVAQDKEDSTDAPEKWHYFTAGAAFNSIPVGVSSGADENYVDRLSFSPLFTVRNRAGLGISYSPKIVSSSPGSGIYVHAITAGIEQYEKDLFDYTLEYSHYFLTTKTYVPYSPISNDVSGS